MLRTNTNAPQTNLFGNDLLLQLDPNDSLIQLFTVISWHYCEERFAIHYSKDVGAPSKPTRLMVGLLTLKQLEDLSDEAVALQRKLSLIIKCFAGSVGFSGNYPATALSWFTLASAFRKI